MQRKQLLRQIKITANEQIYSRAKLLKKYLLQVPTRLVKPKNRNRHI